MTDDTYGKLIVAQTLVENDEKFINEFTANPADALISGTKVLDGRDWLENDQFIFDLKDEAGNVIQTKTAAKIILRSALIRSPILKRVLINTP